MVTLAHIHIYWHNYINNHAWTVTPADEFFYECCNYRARMIVSWAILITIWICKLCKARSATYQVAIGMAVGLWFVMDFVAVQVSDLFVRHVW